MIPKTTLIIKFIDPITFKKHTSTKTYSKIFEPQPSDFTNQLSNFMSKHQILTILSKPVIITNLQYFTNTPQTLLH